MASLHDLIPEYLYTKRLTLERFNHSPEHYKCFLEVINGKTAIEMSGDFGIKTPEAFDAFNLPSRLKLPRFRDGVADDDLIYVIHVNGREQDGGLVGGISICHRIPQGVYLPPDLGWAIVEGQMSQGYATEAAMEVMRWFRDDFGMGDVMVLPGAHNPASIRVAEKLGFVEGGQIPDEASGKMYSIFILPGMKRIELGEGANLDLGNRQKSC